MKNLREKIFLRVREKIEKGNKNFFLYFLSLFFESFSRVRNFLYDKKILKGFRSKAFIISIGNVVAGGVGKTPFTIFLAKKLMDRGKSLAVVSRGYRSRVEREGRNVLVEEKSGEFLARDVGDEPLMIFKRLDGGSVIVGKDRVLSVKKAEKMGVDFVLLDDGFQHRKLERDLEVVVLNAKNLFSEGKFLPFGFLRDNLKRLKGVDLIVLNNVEERQDFERCKGEVRKFSFSKVIGVKPHFFKVKNLSGEEVDFYGKRVGVFCGIGSPKVFIKSLEDLGFKVVLEKFLLDHAEASEEFLEEFCKKAKERGAEGVLCSEKDAVKLGGIREGVLPIFYVEMGLKVVFGKKYFESFLNLISRNDCAI
jgi:tetraacyldisaccharide 4'-kinase